MPRKEDISKLIWRNYTYNDSEDSIDVEDIVRGPSSNFDPETMMHYKIPTDCSKYRMSNI